MRFSVSVRTSGTGRLSSSAESSAGVDTGEPS